MGRKDLEKHIIEFKAIARTAHNKDTFIRNFNRAFKIEEENKTLDLFEIEKD